MCSDGKIQEEEKHSSTGEVEKAISATAQVFEYGLSGPGMSDRLVLQGMNEYEPHMIIVS